MLESHIQELTKAVNRLAEVMESNRNSTVATSGANKAPSVPIPAPVAAPSVAAPTAVAPAPAPATAAAPTLTDLRELGRLAIKAGKQSDMRKVIADHKAESLTTLAAEHYASVHAKLKELVPIAKAA